MKETRCPICNAEYKEAGTTEYRDADTGELVAPPVRTIYADHAEGCALGNLKRRKES